MDLGMTMRAFIRTMLPIGMISAAMLPTWQQAWAVPPLGVSLARCQPGTSGGFLEPGNTGPGFGNSNFDRTFEAGVVFHHPVASEISAAIAQIERIELCWVRWVAGVSQVTCPGGGGWLIFDRSAGMPPPAASEVALCPPPAVEALAGQSFSPSLINRCDPTKWQDKRSFVQFPVMFGGVPAFDWGDASNADRALFLRVVNVGPTPVLDFPAQAELHGSCAIHSIRATGPAVQPGEPVSPIVTSPTPGLAPFRDSASGQALVDVCQGYRIAPPGITLNACVTDAQAEYLRRILALTMDSHDRIQGLLDAAAVLGLPPQPNQRREAWRNGNLGEGDSPVHIKLTDYLGGDARQTLGLVRTLLLGLEPALETPDTLSLPTAPSGAARPPGSEVRSIPAAAGHEIFHLLQDAWFVGDPRIQALIGATLEGMAASVEGNACLRNGFPNEPDINRCVSANKITPTRPDLRASNAGSYYGAFRNILLNPANDALGVEGLNGYNGSAWWSYVYQQFAFPISAPGDPQRVRPPGGTASSIQREQNADQLSPFERRDSDQGIDFIGLLFQQFANTGPGRATFDATDDALRAHLRRSFRDVLFDYHTALFLKDYSDLIPADPRWRVDWAHEDGFTAKTPMSSLKPIPVTSDLLSAFTRDGYRRGRRTLDRGQSIPPACAYREENCATAFPALVPIPLAVGQSQGATNVKLGTYGTTALSVVPASGWAGGYMEVSGTSWAEVGSPPRFRLFRVDSPAFPPLDPLRPVVICDPCQTPAPTMLSPAPTPSLGANVSPRFTQLVPIFPETKEVLLVASNSLGQGGTGLSATFGAAQVAPIALKAIPRVFRNPGSVFEPRPSPLVVTSLQRAITNVAVRLPRGAMTLSVPNCAKATQGVAACTLSAANVQVLPTSGGVTPLAIALPGDFFPTLPSGALGTLDLKVDIANLPSVTSSFQFTARTPTQATVLVMDRTGEIGEETLSATKGAIKALVQSLVPIGPQSTPATEQVALVSYDDDASTLTGPTLVEVTASSVASLEGAIDGMQLGEGASLGDGVFEGQSILANAFDDLPAGSRPDRQVMIVLNGSMNQQGTFSELYVNGSTSPPTGDGNGSWGARPLTWPARNAAGLPQIDAIQTIGFGANADFGRLETLSRLTNSGTLAVAIDSGEPIDLDELTRRMADRVTASYANASRYTRILAGDFHRNLFSGNTGVPLPGIGADTTELRVVVVGSGAQSQSFFLSGPGGIAAEPISGSANSVALKVANPTGNWKLRIGESAPASDGIFFVEATVLAPTVDLVTQVDVSDLPLSPTGQPQALPSVGSPVYVRAIPRDGQPIQGCTVAAVVTDPDGLESAPLRMLDDGQHQDGEADDGVYGTTYGKTGTPGVYGVLVEADCASPATAVPFHRERFTGITLAPIPAGQDTDGDGMPNVWETTYGLNPNSAADGPQDADGDDLSNVNEFQSGTHPRESDSDGGGESDASELLGGRNPVAHDDDRVSSPLVVPTVGNGKVVLPAGMALGAGTLIVDRGPAVNGPWTRLSGVFQSGTYWAVDSSPQNGINVCYRLRVEGVTQGVVSGWSVPKCVTPKTDPYPPTISLDGKPPCGAQGGLSLAFKIADPILPTDHASPIPVDLAVSSSGATQMRSWLGADAPPSTAGWGPVANPLTTTLPDPTKGVVSVQVRDAAGNESDILRVSVPPPGGCLIANAGLDQILQCTAAGVTAQLDASGSRDTNGGLLTFSWSAPGILFSNPTVATPTAVFPSGTTTATVVVTDSTSRSASDTAQVTVVDTAVPVLVVPPDITITSCNSPNVGVATATDACGGTITLTNNKPSKFPLGTTVVTYWAVDAFGNAVSGTQRVTAVLGDDSSCCPAGTTIRLGTSNNDTINGTSGNDCIIGLGAQDTINGLGGSDYISGGEGDDVIDGGSGSDRIYGGNGQDQLRGGTGNDVIEGGGGDDRCWGGDNDDAVRGGQGQDQLFGDGGNDQLFGDEGDDRLEGGDGNDALDGGGLHDICIGGAGTDTFNICQSATQ